MLSGRRSLQRGESEQAAGCHTAAPLARVAEPSPNVVTLLFPNHPSLSDAISKLMVPEWQKPCLVEDGTQCPLHLSVIHQLGRAQAGVVQGEAEAVVKDLVHPG